MKHWIRIFYLVTLTDFGFISSSALLAETNLPDMATIPLSTLTPALSPPRPMPDAPPIQMSISEPEALDECSAAANVSFVANGIPIPFLRFKCRCWSVWIKDANGKAIVGNGNVCSRIGGEERNICYQDAIADLQKKAEADGDPLLKRPLKGSDEIDCTTP